MRLTPATLELDEAGGAQRGKVLRDRLAGDRQLRRKLLLGRVRPRRQRPQHMAPRRVGERAEDEADVGGAQARTTTLDARAASDSRMPQASDAIIAPAGVHSAVSTTRTRLPRATASTLIATVLSAP